MGGNTVQQAIGGLLKEKTRDTLVVDQIFWGLLMLVRFSVVASCIHANSSCVDTCSMFAESLSSVRRQTGNAIGQELDCCNKGSQLCLHGTEYDRMTFYEE
jgi:hypothetical protein